MIIKLAIIGNPNVGKTTLFNKLTGLHQKIGNYPGITVDKKSGFFIYNKKKFKIVDFPGAYSLYPSSNEGEIIFNNLINKYHKLSFDKIVIIIDINNIKRGLFLFYQIQNLEIPILIIFNVNKKIIKNIKNINFYNLEKVFYTKILIFNLINNINIKKIKKEIELLTSIKKNNFNPGLLYNHYVKKIKYHYKLKNDYLAWYYLARGDYFPNKEEGKYLYNFILKEKIISKRLIIKEIFDRYKKINNIIDKYNIKIFNKNLNISEKIDKYLMHPIIGYFTFFILLFLLFQSIYIFSEIPKEIIENSFFLLQNSIKKISSNYLINNLLCNGIIPGIATVLSFIPQTLILLFFILIMEESGYISRVVFLTDRLMRPFGLNGKSIVPLISGTACAIPAIISTRNIENYRDRLITILVTPLITCSARMPIYILIISLIIPDKKIFFLHLKGIILMIIYLIGIISALLVAMIFNIILKKKYDSYLIMEMPDYKWPIFHNIFISLWIYIKLFIINTGKIIISISTIIWILSSFGPEKNIFKINNNIKNYNDSSNNILLEESYLGVIGKKIEPLIKPLGYDWKIGISLLSSFVAREVFVSTMANLYKLDNSKNISLELHEKMKNELKYKTKQKMYDIPTGLSLISFYTFSMQCMSTLVIVKKETKSWKWPIIQFLFMIFLAYTSSFIIYQFLNKIYYV